jgi:hypothetical protein
MITAGRLREITEYDEETGVLRWKICKPPIRAGSEVGGKHISHGYKDAVVEGTRSRVHRLIWLYVNGKWPDGQIDHINGDTTDNRISNLRDVRPQVNSQNKRHPPTHSKSGYLGVCFNTSRGKWKASICVGGRHKHVGHFNTAEEAHAAYVAAKRTLHEGCTI